MSDGGGEIGECVIEQAATTHIDGTENRLGQDYDSSWLLTSLGSFGLGMTSLSFTGAEE